MSDLLGMTLEDIIGTFGRRRVRLPPEIGAFIALETTEALIDAPARIGAAELRVGQDGVISVFAPPSSASDAEAAASVVELLSGLLVAAGGGVPSSLVQIVDRPAELPPWTLGSLRDELESTLVPLNRAAARRVLARMMREAKKLPSIRPASSGDEDGSLDDELDALLEGNPAAQAEAAAITPPSAAASGQADADDVDADLDATLADLDGAASPRVAGLSALDQASIPDATLYDDDPSPDPKPPSATAKADPPAARPAATPAPSRPAADAALDAFEEATEPRRRGWIGWALAFVAVLAAGAAALALTRPDLVDQALGRPPPPPPDPGPTDEDRARARTEHRARFGTLTVRVSPPRAQILMRVGTGPAVAEELPVGVAHEFVALAEGMTPGRAVLPPDAEWERDGESARYELAVQVGQEPMEADQLALGPTRLPQNVGTPSGTLGSVRVITNPPGAEVFVVVGFSPSATLENVRTDEAVEFMFYSEGHVVQRMTVQADDWPSPDGEGHRAHSIAAELVPREGAESDSNE